MTIEKDLLLKEPTMKQLLFLTLGLFSFTTMAQSIHVEYGFNIYDLTITDQEITYTKKEFEAVVKKEKCSTNLFNDFQERMRKLSTEKKPADETKGSEFLVKYKIDNKEGVLTPKHPFAQKLLSIPQEFDVFKLATEFRCEKEKK